MNDAPLITEIRANYSPSSNYPPPLFSCPEKFIGGCYKGNVNGTNYPPFGLDKSA